MIDLAIGCVGNEEHGRGKPVTTAQDDIPQAGSLVEVRGQRWVVGEEPVPGSEGSTLLTLQSVEDGRYGEPCR